MQILKFYRAILTVYCEIKAEMDPEELHEMLKVGFDVFLKGEKKDERIKNRTLTKLTKEDLITYVDYVVRLFCYFGVLFDCDEYKYGKVKFRIVPSRTGF